MDCGIQEAVEILSGGATEFLREMRMPIASTSKAAIASMRNKNGCG